VRSATLSEKVLRMIQREGMEALVSGAEKAERAVRDARAAAQSSRKWPTSDCEYNLRVYGINERLDQSDGLEDVPED
jgi:hypothetical protein